MKIVSKFFLGAALAGLFSASAAKAETGLGLGVASHGSGISVDHSFDASSGFQGLLSLYNHGFAVQGDYLVKSPLNSTLWLYGGPGVRLRTGTDTVTARLPVGIEGNLGKLPLEAGFEVAPSLALKSSSALYLDLALNVRYLVN